MPSPAHAICDNAITIGVFSSLFSSSSLINYVVFTPALGRLWERNERERKIKTNTIVSGKDIEQQKEKTKPEWAEKTTRKWSKTKIRIGGKDREKQERNQS